MLAAHAIPPSAFQNRNVGQRILFIPASHADAIRRPATQRPRKTAFGPCLAKNGSPCSSTFSAVLEQRAGATNTRRPKWRPIAKPTLSPRIAAVAARTVSVAMSIWPAVREQRGADQRRLGRDRDAHRLDRDQREDERVADVRRDVDQGGEHAVNLYRAAAMAIGILTGSGTYALPGLRELGAAAGVHAVGRGAASRAERGRASRSCTSRATAPGHPRLSNHVTHRANIAALKAAGATGVLAVTVCGAVDPVAPSSARWSASTTCTSSPTGCRTARCARSSPSRARASAATGSTRARSRRTCAPRCWPARPRRACAVRDGGCYGHVDGPRFNTARRDPRARRRGRHRGLPDRGPGDGAERRGRAAVRAARLPDRLRQRRQGRGDPGRARWSRTWPPPPRPSPRSCAPRCRASTRRAAGRRLPLHASD